MAEIEKEKVGTTNTGPVVTDHEQSLAQSALADFSKQNYFSCLSHLQKLEQTWTQDYKVSLNKAVVEYYLSGLKNTENFRKSLTALRSAPYNNGEECVGLDDVEHCALYYNYAVLCFHQRKYNLALSIIKQVFTFIEPMEESLAHKVCLLLLELLISLRRVDEALEYVAYIITQFASTKNIQMLEEPTEKKHVVFDAATDAFRQKLLQYQTRCYLLAGHLVGVQRELKAIEVAGGADDVTNLFLAAHSEYLRGNFERSSEFLNRARQLPWPGTKETGVSINLLYHNNMGCLRHRAGKPHLAAFCFKKSLEEHEEVEKLFGRTDSNDSTSHRPLYSLNGMQTAQLMYNIGISQLYHNQPSQAFDCLLQAAQVFHMNPRLWLRMAECCIMTHKKGNHEEFAMHGKRKQIIGSIIGSGAHRKAIVLSTISRGGTYSGSEQSYAIPAPTLEFASLCLKNALLLLPHGVEGERKTVWVSPPATPTNLQKERPWPRTSMFGAPSSLISDSEVRSLRVSSLTASSYVALYLGDYVSALQRAEELLKETVVPGAHKMLAHLYAAEALVHLDRVNEAMEHLHPDNVVDLEVTSLESGDMASLPRNWYPDKALTGKLVMQYNMAVAFSMRGQLDKAGELLKRIWALKTKADIPLQIVMMAMYIELQLGHVENTRSILKQHFPLTAK